VNWLIKWVKKLRTRFVRLKGPPREIALGFALGLYVGMSPTMGIQMAIAVGLASLFKWNMIAAATGVWISNPLTAPILYGSTYFVGKSLIGIVNHPAQPLPNPETMTLWGLIERTPHVLWAMVLGGLILGVPVAMVGYHMSYQAILQYRKRLKDRVTDALDKVKSHRRKKRDDSAQESDPKPPSED